MSQTTSQASDSTRNIALDIAKGLCIILMVVGHSGCPDWIRRMIYAFHMPCFFIISGMLYKAKYNSDGKTFVKRKVKTLWWPFVKWNIFLIIMHNILVYCHIYEIEYNFKYMTLKVLMTSVMWWFDPLVEGFWFVYALFVSSLLCLLFFKFIGFSTQKLLGGILIFLVIDFFLHTASVRFYLLQAVFLASAYFMTGCLLVRLPEFDYKFSRFLYPFSLVLLLVATFVLPYCDVCNVIPEYLGWFFISSTIISYAIIVALKRSSFGIISRILCKIGRHSLDIVTWHLLAFKSITFILIMLYNMPISHMADYYVIKGLSWNFWYLYAFAGIILPLIVGKSTRLISDLIQLTIKNFTASKRLPLTPKI